MLLTTDNVINYREPRRVVWNIPYIQVNKPEAEMRLPVFGLPTATSAARA